MMKRLGKTCCLIILFCITLGCMIPQEALAKEKFKLKKSSSDEDWLTVELKDDTWSAASPSLTLSIKLKETKIVLSTSSTEYVAKLSDEKTKIYNADESLRFVIKKSDEKIKILQSEDDPTPWSLSLKDEGTRYKIVKGETEIGKVKFYLDTGKNKTKNLEDETVCDITTNSLLPGAAVCLFSELSEEDQLLLFTVLTMEYH